MRYPGTLAKPLVANTVLSGFILLCALMTCPRASFGYSSSSSLLQSRLVGIFYEMNEGKLVWMCEDAKSADKRTLLIQVIDSCGYLGLNPEHYGIMKLRQFAAPEYLTTEIAIEADRHFTGALISLAKDLTLGKDVSKIIKYDELSSKCLKADEEGILGSILKIDNTADLASFMAGLEPKDSIYNILKGELRKQIHAKDFVKAGLVGVTMDFHRWMSHFRLRRFIVVNIPSATLQYLEEDSIILNMKAVVGKPATRTPRFVAHTDKVILYPYWNVPASIAPELLRIIYRDRSMLEAMNLQIIDGKGRVIDPSRINWASYSTKNFPYRLRQSTGCDNALGVIKFNLTSPFGVYLHDTNAKPMFALNNRFFSHGCIRVAEPVELAVKLLDRPIDSQFLAACIRGQEPVTEKIEEPVPVFVVYTPCSINFEKEVVYHKDVYNLL